MSLSPTKFLSVSIPFLAPSPSSTTRTPFPILSMSCWARRNPVDVMLGKAQSCRCHAGQGAILSMSCWARRNPVDVMLGKALVEGSVHDVTSTPLVDRCTYHCLARPRQVTLGGHVHVHVYETPGRTRHDTYSSSSNRKHDTYTLAQSCRASLIDRCTHRQVHVSLPRETTSGHARRTRTRTRVCHVYGVSDTRRVCHAAAYMVGVHGVTHGHVLRYTRAYRVRRTWTRA